MKLKRFIKKASRAESLRSQVPPDVIGTIKELDERDIKRLFRDFVPLDFVALIQHYNPKTFNRVIHEMLKTMVAQGQIRTWIEAINVRPEDVIQQAYLLMLKQDTNPHRTGVLAQITAEGSGSATFEYVTKDQPQTRIDLANSVAPISNSNAIKVPHCPVDQSLGIDHPLWSLSTEGGEIEIDEGLDKQGRCTQAELLGELSEEDFLILETLQDSEMLTEEQKQQLQNGQRSLEYFEGQVFLRCTFHAKLNTFKFFLFTQAYKAIDRLRKAYFKEHGLTITSKQFQELNTLQQKESDKTITPEQAQRLEQLRKLIAKKSSEAVRSIGFQSSKDDDEDDRSLEELIGKEYNQDESDAQIELGRVLSDEQMGHLNSIATYALAPLGRVATLLEEIQDTPLRDPKRQALLSQVNNETSKIAQKYLSSLRDLLGRTSNPTELLASISPTIKTYLIESSKSRGSGSGPQCQTCLARIGELKYCPFADQMKLNVYRTYEATKTFQEFASRLKLSETAKKHYEQSNLESILNRAYTILEVSEVDIDFSSSNQEHSKLSLNELKKEIYHELSEDEIKAFEGTKLIFQEEEEVNEEETEVIDEISTILQNLFSEILQGEISSEFRSYIKSRVVND